MSSVAASIETEKVEDWSHRLRFDTEPVLSLSHCCSGTRNVDLCRGHFFLACPASRLAPVVRNSEFVTFSRIAPAFLLACTVALRQDLL